MPQRAVLFDIDGVLVRNPVISAAIERRAVSYVRSRAKLSGAREAAGVNRKLYTTYGHTHTGMKVVYRVAETIDDYNAYVYDRETLFFCFKELVRGYDRNDSRAAMNVIASLRKKGVPVYLFTNAPDVWADALVQALDLDIRTERRLTSSFGVKMGGDVCLYERVSDYVAEVDGPRELVYVEDTFRNLTPVMHHPNWQPVLFEPYDDGHGEQDAERATSAKHIGRAQVVRELSEVELYIRTS